MITEPTKRPGMSSAARDAILAQHEHVRSVAAGVSELAGLSATSAEAVEPLRTRTLALFTALEEHLRFEEDVLEVALRDVTGRGPELHAEIERDHQRQRAILALATRELRRPGLPSHELVGGVRRFVDLLLRDMEAEEEVLLSAEVDALMADGEAGD